MTYHVGVRFAAGLLLAVDARDAQKLVRRAHRLQSVRRRAEVGARLAAERAEAVAAQALHQFRGGGRGRHKSDGELAREGLREEELELAVGGGRRRRAVRGVADRVGAEFRAQAVWFAAVLWPEQIEP